MNTQMPELKTGMIVRRRDGDMYRVFTNTSYGELVFANEYGWEPWHNYYTDGEHQKYSFMSIDAVYKTNPRNYGRSIDSVFKTLIWERREEEPAKKMTVAEVAEALGHKVEIVEG